MTVKKIKTPIAARAIAIDGKHFAQGDVIKGVDAKEVENCVRLGSVVDAASEEGEAAQMEATAREEAAAAPEKKA